MSFKLFDPYSDSEWSYRRNLILLVGQTGSGKTTSLRTFLKEHERMAYIEYPGEYGSTSLTVQVPGQVQAWASEMKPEAVTGVNWEQEVREVKQLTTQIIKGEYGPFDVFAGDGLHKFAQLLLNKVTGGVSARTLSTDEKAGGFSASLYGDLRLELMGYLQFVFRAVHAGVFKRAVFAVWDDPERDHPEWKSKEEIRQDTQHLWPALPGKLARWIVGEFGCVLYADRKGPLNDPFRWQTKQHGSVWGVGIKAPLPLSQQVPLYVPQDWGKLEPLLTAASTSVPIAAMKE